jgi:hypothetical protein
MVIRVRRVYLDLSSRGLKGLIPPPHELEDFIRPTSSGDDAEFIYLEALSLAHNQLTFLGDGLLQIKHLPLLMELDVSHNQLDALDEGAALLSLSRLSSSRPFPRVHMRPCVVSCTHVPCVCERRGVRVDGHAGTVESVAEQAGLPAA